MNKTCQRCAASFSTEDKRRKFCGVVCYRAKASEQPSRTTFAPGQKPWNKNLKGIHLSPATEFKPGQRPASAVRVGTVRIRNDRSGNPRAWVKVAEPNKWRLRAVVNFEKSFGPPPPGAVVHHRNHNTLNDDPANLQAISRRDHFLHHMPKIERNRRRATKAAETRGLSLSAARAGQTSLFDILNPEIP